MEESKLDAEGRAVDVHGRLLGEAHTSSALDGSTASQLDAAAAASSLFALQQILQRDDAAQTAAALDALARGVRSRDAAAVATASAWASSSPRLAELFRRRNSREDDASTLAKYRVLAAMLPTLADPVAAWSFAARDWGSFLQKHVRGSHAALRRAALELLEAASLRGRGAAAAARWVSERWNDLAELRRARDGARQPCVRLCAAILRGGDAARRVSNARAAVVP